MNDDLHLTPPRMRRRTDGRAILVVEDNEDMRILLDIALRREGYEVAIADTAEAGLRRLATETYDLLLTDYLLPAHSGDWLLRQARDRGLLDRTPALIVTANPDAPDLIGRRGVVEKPVDFARLLPQIRAILGDGGETAGPPGARGTGGPMAASTLELVLYITADSLASQRALRAMREILARYQPDAIDFTVRDLAADPEAAERDRVVFTPTLVKRSPRPHVWVLGDLSRPEVVTDLLTLCGVAPISAK